MSLIITSGTVRPYESWKAVTGSGHTLSVPVAVVCALRDRICGYSSEQLLITHLIVILEKIRNSSIYHLTAAPIKKYCETTKILIFLFPPPCMNLGFLGTPYLEYSYQAWHTFTAICPGPTKV